MVQCGSLDVTPSNFPAKSGVWNPEVNGSTNDSIIKQTIKWVERFR
jgi:hypothetical protein